MSTHFFLYPNMARRPGSLLGTYLGMPHGTRDVMENRRYTYVIRFGCTARISHMPSERTINRLEAISRNTNKLQSLEIMREAGIQTVPFSINPNDLIYPVVGRSSNHIGGSDIRLYLQPADLEYMEGSRPSFFTQYIPRQNEWRVHVANHKILCILLKVPQRENYNQLLCSHSGWRYVEISDVPSDLMHSLTVIDTIDLDFGAVDVMQGMDNQIYFLEANTAPGFSDENYTVKQYARELATMTEWQIPTAERG